MKYAPIALIISFIALSGTLFAQPLPNAHAHNDYEHPRPLLDALDNGFTSVEADVYWVEGTFYVYHDLPATLDPTRTLENLYLKPLQKRVKANKGRVYPGYDDFFYLMIDFKSDADPAYEELKKLLRKYRRMISIVKNDQDEPRKPLKIFISGHAGKRPYDEILADAQKLVALDGRADELGRGISAAVMPVVSENYNKFLSWKGNGTVNPQELEKLQYVVQYAHAEGKKVRLWAAPDVPEVWAFLLDQGVDLINTDRLPALRQYLLQRKTTTTNRN